MADPVLFRDLAYVFLAALVGGVLAWLVRQPLILGYVVGGILISPFTPGPTVERSQSFELLAEVGVVLLMFSIGIEFSLRDLLRVKWVALIGGPLGIFLSVAFALAVGAVFGWPPLYATVIGLVLSVASTMVMARLLMDRGELHSPHGRVLIGISLVEDLAVVVMTVLIPVLGDLAPDRLVGLGVALGKALAILLPFAYLATKVFPPLMTRVVRSRNPELFLLVALAAGLGTAALSQAVGLSLALGAFLAGLIVSESDYAHETLARLLPLRDAFVALFFVTVGALVDPGAVVDHLPLLGAIVGLTVVGKLVARTLVVRLFGYPLSTALLAGIGFTQIGEFSYVLVQAARNAGHVGPEVYNATLAASLLTILINAALFRTVPGWVARWRLSRASDRLSATAIDPKTLRDHVLVLGFGRVGSAVGEALDTFRVPYAVIETDPDIVKALKARGLVALYGDGVHERVLEAAHADRARLAVVTIPDGDRGRLAVRALHRMNAGLRVLVRAHDATIAEELEHAGATVVRPEVEAATALVRHALGGVPLPADRVRAYLDRFRQAMELPETETPLSEADRLPQVHDVIVGAGELADQTLREARIRERFGVTVLAIERADGHEVLLNPPPETHLRPGDRVRLFGLPEQIAAFRAAATGPREREAPRTSGKHS
jgi:CPA2 family monovalent cation:H+ antiporter-2